MRIQTVLIYTCAVKPVTIVKSLTETCSQTEHNIFNLFCRVRLSLKIEPKASSSNLNGKASSRSRESISGEYRVLDVFLQSDITIVHHVFHSSFFTSIFSVDLSLRGRWFSTMY